MNKFSQRLLELRKENDMTQEDICKQLYERFGYEIKKSMISRYENGIHEPNYYFIQLVAEIFGVTSDYLMGRSDNKYGLESEKRTIPVLKVIEADKPISIAENIIGYEYSEDCDFCLKVKGDFMVGARIFDGDIVYIKQQNTVENGEIAAVIIAGEEEAIIRRYYYVDGIVRLHAENPLCPDMVFSKKDIKQIRILGKVKYFKSEVK